MSFSETQIKALNRTVPPRHIRTRENNGRELTYIEGWHAVAEANRIFGFDGWDRETVEARCVMGRENKGAYLAVYIARVRVTVRANGSLVVRDGHGSGTRCPGRHPSPLLLLHLLLQCSGVERFSQSPAEPTTF